MMDEEILKACQEQLPYFRTPEFSATVLENEKMLLEIANAPKGSRIAFLTTSGTGGMEACVTNIFDSKDKVIVVNGGGFGQRFADLCKIHKIPYDEIRKKQGENITQADIDKFDGKGYTGFIVNIHETSTGVLYDKKIISDFCKKNRIKLVVDAISSFLADPIDMQALGAYAIIIGSQKAIALPPGMSCLFLSPDCVRQIYDRTNTECMYLDLKIALKNGERGQTPFTPAVGVLLMMNKRLKQIMSKGVDATLNHVRDLALYFRSRIIGYPFVIASKYPSNALTVLSPSDKCKMKPSELFETMKNEYDIFICPNGGEFKEKLFRIGHIGALEKSDYDRLFDAFDDLMRQGRL
ncbi:MAG TPA: aspartate aminotransferase [Spirochaetaceae bacterium]|nr:aspartate aminotransferase [Spirochaetaceae bacterium]